MGDDREKLKQRIWREGIIAVVLLAAIVYGWNFAYNGLLFIVRFDTAYFNGQPMAPDIAKRVTDLIFSWVINVLTTVGLMVLDGFFVWHVVRSISALRAGDK